MITIAGQREHPNLYSDNDLKCNFLPLNSDASFVRFTGPFHFDIGISGQTFGFYLLSCFESRGDLI
jgi:hypothetical protein